MVEDLGMLDVVRDLFLGPDRLIGGLHLNGVVSVPSKDPAVAIPSQ